MHFLWTSWTFKPLHIKLQFVKLQAFKTRKFVFLSIIWDTEKKTVTVSFVNFWLNNVDVVKEYCIKVKKKESR